MIFNNIVRAGAIALVTGAMASCGVYTKYQTPTDTAMTRDYVEARDARPDSTALGNLLWEDVFTDPVLQGYIRQALSNNLNVKDALLNVELARTQLKGARLAYFPSVAIAPQGSGSGVGSAGLSWGYQIPAQVSWEVDAFGKLLNNKRSAQIGVDVAQAQSQSVRSQVIGAVANTYYAMASVEDQLALARTTAGLWLESLRVMRDLKEAGRLTEAAVVQSDANYQSVLASITDLEVTRHNLDNTMSQLLGTMPMQWHVAKDATLAMPACTQQGVPMLYLANRPDVYAAERSLATAYYATNSARAAFYPGLTITAAGGFTNQLGSMIKNPGEWFYNLGASLVAPLFSRGQNIARLEAAKISQQMAMNKFESTVLAAAGEVSDALTTYDKANRRIVYLEKQADDLEKAVQYTNDLMIYADGTYLEVITAQQGLLQARMNIISTRLTSTQAIINMYRAMGGGR